MDGSKFNYVTYIRTTPEKLWHALIDPEFTRRYWVETWQESDWEKGSSWRIMIPDGRGGQWRNPGNRQAPSIGHLVAERIPTRRLRLRFLRCTYTIEPLIDCVKFTLTHEMDICPSKLINKVSNGWPIILSSLKSLLETGKALEQTSHWPTGL